jgi:hypothetical protein
MRPNIDELRPRVRFVVVLNKIIPSGAVVHRLSVDIGGNIIGIMNKISVEYTLHI